MALRPQPCSGLGKTILRRASSPSPSVGVSLASLSQKRSPAFSTSAFHRIPPGSQPSLNRLSLSSSPSLGAFSFSLSSMGPSRSMAWRLFSSHQPEHTIYTGPSSPPASRVTLRTIRRKYERGEPLTMVTAYDYPSAVHVESAGMDMILVGDSAAMVIHGHDTTLPITLEEMLVHCRAVCRGSRRCLVVGDLPFGSFESSPLEAVHTAVRFMKEGGVDAVKIECGPPSRVALARAMVETGVAVIGHIGLTPQSVSVIGGFRPQAQVADEAIRLVEQAIELERAGCFAILLECVPGPVAAAVTRAVNIPTIGIGAGSACSGQVLVYHDLLGMLSHPHHAKVAPKFCKRFAEVGREIERGLTQFREQVTRGEFPAGQFSPYRIAASEAAELEAQLRQRGFAEAADTLASNARAEELEKGVVPEKGKK